MGVRWTRGKVLSDDRQHARGSTQDVVVAEAQDGEALCAKVFGSLEVLRDLALVIPAVHFDNQSRFAADEIGDEAADRVLAPEVVAAELIVAEVAPQVLLRRSRAPAEQPRSTCCGLHAQEL